MGLLKFPVLPQRFISFLYVCLLSLVLFAENPLVEEKQEEAVLKLDSFQPNPEIGAFLKNVPLLGLSWKFFSVSLQISISSAQSYIHDWHCFWS